MYYYIDNNEEKCDECKNGYAPSNDYSSCIKFDNCEYLNDNSHCNYCKEGYSLSNDQTSCIKFDKCYL